MGLNKRAVEPQALMCHAKTLSFIPQGNRKDLGLTQRSDVCRITSYKDQTAEVWKRIGRAD